MGLQICVIWHDWGRRSCAGNARLDIGGYDCCGDFGTVGDQAVVVGFLDPFVDDGAGPDAVHCRAEDRALVLECARLHGVAARLGEEDGNVVVLGVGVERVVAGSHHVVVPAPFVRVQAEHVN